MVLTDSCPLVLRGSKAAVCTRTSPPGRLGGFTADLMVWLQLVKKRVLAHNASIGLLIKYYRLLDFQRVDPDMLITVGGERRKRDSHGVWRTDLREYVNIYTQLSTPMFQHWGILQ